MLFSAIDVDSITYRIRDTGVVVLRFVQCHRGPIPTSLVASSSSSGTSHKVPGKICNVGIVHE